MIAVENLADALLAVVDRPAARDVSGAYFVAGSDTAGVRQIFEWLRAGMDVPARLVAVPPSLLRGALTFAGFGRPIARLLART